MWVQFSNMVDTPVVATIGAVLEQGGNARCCDDRCIGVLQSRKLWRFRSCRAWSMFARSSSTVVNVPMLMQRRCFSCSSWTRSSSWPLRADSAGVQTCRKLCCSTVAVLDKVVDVPVIKQRRLRSGSAPDSVHRQSPWTFQLCNRFACGVYGGDEVWRFGWAWEGLFRRH